MIYNRTTFSKDDAMRLPLLKTVRSEWRRRTITLHQHPEDDNLIVSIGCSWDSDDVVICVETRSDWRRELSSSKVIVTTQ